MTQKRYVRAKANLFIFWAIWSAVA